MEFAARPHITTGVALAAASVIAVGPVTRHLPDLQVGQQLREVAVSTVQLTDAASSMIDLFSGVENQLASLAGGGAAAAAVPAGVLADVVNPFQTWVNTFATAGSNLQYIFAQWSQIPFPVMQQVAANGVQYASDYVGAYQTAAASLVKEIPKFGPAFQTGLADIAAGNVSTGIFYLYQNLFQKPFIAISAPLESTLKIPAYMTQNLANAVNYFSGAGIANVAQYTLSTATVSAHGLGAALQAVYNSWTADDLAGTLSNLANAPGVVANAFINGFETDAVSGVTGGLLSSGAFPAQITPNGLLNEVLNVVDPQLAQEIVAPNAQNIVSGGSLLTGIQNFVNQFIGGWPSLGASLNTIGGDIAGSLTSMLQSLPSVAAGLPSMLGTIATQIGTAIINLLRML
ncbi:hypothetical protein [Mycobacterium malmoense]|uniref:hypothetical protein n=1 Tax=Mycobacterium malmoense TaxID=1780 RepID=UPI00114D4AB8|nr:hypothetical protein [Mycobacterium malmoense]